MFCENCGKEVSESAKFCPSCGEKTDKKEHAEKKEHKSTIQSKQEKIAKPKTNKKVIAIVGWTITILIIGFIIYNRMQMGAVSDINSEVYTYSSQMSNYQGQMDELITDWNTIAQDTNLNAEAKITKLNSIGKEYVKQSELYKSQANSYLSYLEPNRDRLKKHGLNVDQEKSTVNTNLAQLNNNNRAMRETVEELSQAQQQQSKALLNLLSLFI